MTERGPDDSLRVGIVGTSWWADAMYLPALSALDDVVVVGACGRNRGRAETFAGRWGIEHVSTDAASFIDPDLLDAVVIASANDTHEELTGLALERGLHVLCEKPIATSADGANRMANQAAASPSLATLVPFTYRYMPTNQYVKQLIDDGFVGDVRHVNLRYFTGFARAGEYSWRFDTELAGSGVVGDIGSHWLDLARWLCGEIVEIGAVTDRFVPRPARRPDGSVYEPSEDSAVITVRFASGALGSIHVSAVCLEGGDFDQLHEVDVHGTSGTLHSTNDWIQRQEVRGLRDGDGAPVELAIPPSVWGAARRDTVHNTYRDVFRVNRAMIGDWVDAARTGSAVSPDLADGARIQELIELAIRSSEVGGAMLDARRRP